MKNQKYYGGERVESGRVRLLRVDNWPDLVKELLSHPALVNLTKEQFMALPKGERDQLKRAAFITPACFNSDDSPRGYENATVCNLIALDIDDGADAAPFAKDPQALVEALAPHPFAAYHTASSTTETPRLRILVAADSIPIPNYETAVRYVASRLGLREVTRESFVPVQPMFVPTMFAGDDPLITHPLIVSVEEGILVTKEDRPEKSLEVPNPQPSPAEVANVDDLDFLRPQVEGLTLEEVSQALYAISPDCGYSDWLSVCAALRHQFPRDPVATKAYELFDLWSSKGSKYVGTEDTRAKWCSLRVNPKGRKPITIRTLFTMAEATGWKSTDLATKCYNEVQDWIQSAKRTPVELLKQGVKRIAATPLQSSVERAALLGLLANKLKTVGVKVPFPDLKRDLARLERVLPSPEGKVLKSTPDNQLPPWARGTCYVSGSNEFYQRMSDRKLPPDILDKVHSVQLMPSNTEESASGRPSMRPQDYLLNVVKVPRVDQYRYSPEHYETTFIQEGDKRFVNTYRPTFPEPNPLTGDAAGKVIMRHLNNLFPEPEYIRTLVDFLAYQVQHPGKKIRWAVLIQGAQGCGKTAIAEIMHAALGKGNFRYVDVNDLFGQFTGWAACSQFICIEEVRIVGHNRHEVMNKLKPCISNDNVSVRRMYTESIQEPNITNYLLLTNHQDAIAVSEEDRRYFVLFSSIQTKEQVKKLPAGYFEELFGHIIGNAAGIRAWLEGWKISKDFNPDGHAPKTKYLSKLATASATPLTVAVADVLTDKLHPLVQSDLISLTALRGLCEIARVPPFTDQSLGAVLRDMDYVQVGRRTIDGQRHSIWARRDVTLGEEDIIAVMSDRITETLKNTLD